MPTISTNDFKNGMTIILRNELWDIVEFQFVKPGKGGAFVRTKLKNVKTGSVLEHTFDSKAKVEQAIIEKKEMEYLYRDSDSFFFMDPDSYEQIPIGMDLLKPLLPFLKENTVCGFKLSGDEILTVALPDFMIFEITDTAPWIKGSTATAGLKPAEIETGTSIKVPLYMTTGEKVRVDTRTGEFIERVNE